MTFIDWSDSEAMLGLLIEWVADERNASGDPARGEFLAGLSAELRGLAERYDAMSHEELLESMRAAYEAGVAELPGDPALVHLAACIEEMERLGGEA